jgi:hypothetical protein
MKRILVKLSLFIALFLVVSQAATSAKSAIEEASKAGQYLFLTFYEANDAQLSAMTKTVEDFKKSNTKKIILYSAKVSDPANKEITSKFGIQNGQTPLLLVIAPNGAVSGGYPGVVTSEQLNQSISHSELMLNVIKSLQEQKVTLVALQNGATKFNTESWKGVQEFSNDSTLKKLTTAIKADPATSGCQEFLKQCQLISPLTQATVVVLLPPGRIGKIFTGQTTKADILKSLQSCTPGSGCCSDKRYKKDVAAIDSAIDKVSQLQGVTYNWNRSDFPYKFFPESRQIGLIAQDVESIIPEVVQTDANGFKTITYDKLTAVLIEAIKEMKQRIDSQDSLIKTQNKRIQILENYKQ